MRTSILALCLVAAACGTPADTSGPTPEEVVRDHSDLLGRILADSGHAGETLALGAPLDVYMVRLDELSRYRGGAFEALLHGLPQRFFPLHGADGTVRTSVTLIRSGSGWELARAGASHLADKVVAARAHWAPGVREVGLVRVPGLNLALLAGADTDGGQLTLTPLEDHARLGLQADHAQPANVLLAQLAPAAEKTLAEDSER